MRPVQVIETGTAFVIVQYPYRKTPDLYIALRNEPVFCAQCEATFPPQEFAAHVEQHDRRRKRQKVANA